MPVYYTSLITDKNHSDVPADCWRHLRCTGHFEIHICVCAARCWDGFALGVVSLAHPRRVVVVKLFSDP